MIGKMLASVWANGISGCFVIGFHMCFDLMHIPGLLACRGVYTPMNLAAAGTAGT